MIQAACGILQSRLHVLPFQIGHFFKDLLGAQAGRQQIKHVNYSNSHATDTRLPATLLGVDRYSIRQIRHNSLQPRNCHAVNIPLLPTSFNRGFPDTGQSQSAPNGYMKSVNRVAPSHERLWR